MFVLASQLYFENLVDPSLVFPFLPAGYHPKEIAVLVGATFFAKQHH